MPTLIRAGTRAALYLRVSGIDQTTDTSGQLAREYDEQIAAMDEELGRKRRRAFIPGDPSDVLPGTSRRKTG